MSLNLCVSTGVEWCGNKHFTFVFYKEYVNPIAGYGRFTCKPVYCRQLGTPAGCHGLDNAGGNQQGAIMESISLFIMKDKLYCRPKLHRLAGIAAKFGICDLVTVPTFTKYESFSPAFRNS